VLLGQVEPTRIDVDALEGRLQSPEFAPLAQSLRQIGFDSAVALLSTYGGRGPELEPWLKDAEVNRDDNLRLQFLAGLRHERRSTRRDLSGNPRAQALPRGSVHWISWQFEYAAGCNCFAMTLSVYHVLGNNALCCCAWKGATLFIPYPAEFGDLSWWDKPLMKHSVCVARWRREV